MANINTYDTSVHSIPYYSFSDPTMYNTVVLPSLSYRIYIESSVKYIYFYNSLNKDLATSINGKYITIYYNGAEYYAGGIYVLSETEILNTNITAGGVNKLGYPKYVYNINGGQGGAGGGGIGGASGYGAQGGTGYNLWVSSGGGGGGGASGYGRIDGEALSNTTGVSLSIGDTIRWASSDGTGVVKGGAAGIGATVLANSGTSGGIGNSCIIYVNETPVVTAAGAPGAGGGAYGFNGGNGSSSSGGSAGIRGATGGALGTNGKSGNRRTTSTGGGILYASGASGGNYGASINGSGRGSAGASSKTIQWSSSLNPNYPGTASNASPPISSYVAVVLKEIHLMPSI